MFASQNIQLSIAKFVSRYKTSEHWPSLDGDGNSFMLPVEALMPSQALHNIQQNLVGSKPLHL